VDFLESRDSIHRVSWRYQATSLIENWLTGVS